MFQLFRRAFISSISVMGLLAVSAADNIPWPSTDTELNDIDPRLPLGRYVQYEASNTVTKTVILTNGVLTIGKETVDLKDKGDFTTNNTALVQAIVEVAAVSNNYNTVSNKAMNSVQWDVQPEDATHELLMGMRKIVFGNNAEFFGGPSFSFCLRDGPSSTPVNSILQPDGSPVATFNMVEGVLNNSPNVVHTSGNESISGVKTFTQNVVINASLRNGNGVTASGTRSHAQGISSTATGDYSHAEGDDTKAIGDHSHAEGYLSEARGIDSHAEGHSTISSGKRAHAEGFQTSATNNQSHAEGRITIAGGYHSHAEGRGSIALGDQSHAEGAQTIAAGHQSHTDGFMAMSAERGESVNDIMNPHAGAYVWQGMPDTVSLVTDIAAEDALTPGQRLTPEELTNTYYHSHGVGTFNINPVGGLEGFWIGETNLANHISALIQTPVAPSTEDLAQGKSADAKATGDALAALEGGFTPWSVTPATTPGGDAIWLTYQGGGWIPMAGNPAMPVGAPKVATEDVLTISWAEGTEAAYAITATRSRTAAWTLADGKYAKPSAGIPASDLAQAVQTALLEIPGKASAADLRYRIAEAESPRLPTGVTIWWNDEQQTVASLQPMYDGSDVLDEWLMQIQPSGGEIVWGPDGSYGGKSDAEINFKQNGSTVSPPDLDLSYLLADRTVNLITATDETSIDIVFPDPQSGYSRDFYIRIELASGITNAPSISCPTNITLNLPDGKFPEIATSTNGTAVTILHFTETKANTFAVTSLLNGGEGIPKITHISHADLTSLCIAEKLIPGAQYRITNYVATTTQEYTMATNHVFDIIVTADSTNVLNETARAIRHDGDTYFPAATKFEAWELKYCVFNDNTRFLWADITNGKGVVYRMKDEFNNDCPYDFKNILFQRWAITNVTSSLLSQDAIASLSESFVFTNNEGKFFAYKDSDIEIVDETSAETSFKLYVDASNTKFYFTFDSGSTSDNSISGHSNAVYSNRIKEYVTNSRITLNCIVFLGNDCFSNTFGNGCYSNTFGNYCNSNTFGNYCYYNTFGNYCNSNTFGNYCNSNTSGNYCNSNTFGNDCYSNTSGNYCYYNTFGNYCFSNTFGNGCYSNTFGNYCNSNTFGNDCNSNTSGNGCYSNTFGNYCNSNTFGNDCNSNTSGNYCNSNTFGNDCSYNTFGNGYDVIGDVYQYISFDAGVQGLTLYATNAIAQGATYRYVEVKSGISSVTIVDTNMNQNVHTTYQPQNSITIDVNVTE